MDRDRGLRLVGVVTSALAAVSLAGIGATTALAAGETKHQDALKAVDAALAQPPAAPDAPGTIEPGTATSRPKASPKPKRPGAATAPPTVPSTGS